MADTVNLAYKAWPERIYVLDGQRRIAYRSGIGPRGFKPNEAARALAELLVGSAAKPAEPRVADDARVTKLELDLAQLAQGLVRYQLKNAALPPSGNANLVEALTGTKTGVELVRGLVLDARGLLNDPWGHPLVYRIGSDPEAVNKNRFDLYSVGPNGKDEKGSGDDVVAR